MATPEPAEPTLTEQLFTAINLEYEYDVVSLLKAGADPNAVNAHGSTPLSHACQSDNDASVVIVKALLAAGALPDKVVSGGYTALACAAEYSSAGVVQALIEGGADVNIARGDGVQPVCIAAARSYTPAARAVVRVLLDAGADVNARDAEEVPLLLSAVRDGRMELAELLLEYDVDVNGSGHSGTTILMTVASSYRNVKFLERFVRHVSSDGTLADVNAYDIVGKTALGLSYSPEKTRLLVSAGACLEAAAHTSGLTTVATSLMEARVAVLRELLRLGADPTVPPVSARGLVSLASIVIAGASAETVLYQYVVDEVAEWGRVGL